MKHTDWLPLYGEDTDAAISAAEHLHAACLDMVDIRNAVPALVHGLMGPHASLARACARALAGLASNGGHVELALPALCARLAHDDAELRDAAWLAVEELVRTALEHPSQFRVRANLGVLPGVVPEAYRDEARALLERLGAD
jgi:hypothetical protein